MEKLFIKNRQGLDISVVVDVTKEQKGLVFVMHGLGGFKEQLHIQTFAKAFKEEGFTTVLFDTTNTFGESEGTYENATVTNYYFDLIDVINWAKKQQWYEEPFWLIGHSLGGISIALYAENFPEQVKAVAPISTVVSGELHHQNIPKEKLNEFEKTGWRTSPSQSKPGIIKKLNWLQFSEDIQKYDLLKEVNKLNMPVLLIVGDSDESTPLEHQKILFEKLLGDKELHVIKGAHHTFRGEVHLVEIKAIIKKWIKNVQMLSQE